MESAHLQHQHQLQNQLLGSSNLATVSSIYGVGATHAWTQSTTLNSSDFNPNCSEVVLNPRQKTDTLIPPLKSSMIQDFGIPWISNAGCLTSHSAHDLQPSKIKDQLSGDPFPKFSEVLSCPPSIEASHLSSTGYIKDEHKDLNDLTARLLLKTVSSDFPINGHQFSVGEIHSSAINSSSFGSAIHSRGTCSQIYPSINISSLNNSASSISGSVDVNVQAVDLLTSNRSSGNFDHPSHDNLDIYKEGLSRGLECLQQSSHRPSCNLSHISSTKEITEAKRHNCLVEPKPITQAAPKKARLESRASCPPFKVRKEKLGDRIAALQQMVAPFGKTDTASVLMEAIGYIKFLQNQVETLSVPYMKSSRNKSTKTSPKVSTMVDGNGEPKNDLKSRGLCLVPLSCMSYVSGDGGGGGGIWPPPSFGGGT